MIEIEKPQIECIENPADETYGKYVVEPLEREKGTLKGTVAHIPTREEIDTPVEEHLIVELYSK